MTKITEKEFDYFLGKINFGASFLDAKAIDIMNRLNTLFKKDDCKSCGNYINDKFESVNCNGCSNNPFYINCFTDKNKGKRR